jgi:uncharacterized RDD family membrane protein YckC
MAYIIDFIFLTPLFIISIFLSSIAASPLILKIWSIIAFFLIIIFFTFFTFLYGRTPGKMMMNIIILGQNGKLPTLQQSILRSLGYFLTSMLLLKIIDISMILFDKNRRSLRDMAANTMVISSDNMIDHSIRKIILSIIIVILLCDILFLQMIDLTVISDSVGKELNKNN